jgi:hypothetical protein
MQWRFFIQRVTELFAFVAHVEVELAIRAKNER